VRVAFDTGAAREQPTGITRYVRELAQVLPGRGVDLHRYVVSFTAKDVDVDVRHVRFPARALDIGWRLLSRPVIESLVGPVDLVHGTNFVLPPAHEAKGVVTVHDLAFARRDGGVRDRRLRAMTPWSVRRADAIIVPSRVVAEEVMERYGVPQERVAVTPEGVSSRFFDPSPLPPARLAALGISIPFVAAVGTIQPRKNLNRLIEAWRRAAAELRGWTLALIGPAGWGNQPPTMPGVIRTGWLPDDLLPHVLASASFFCYPSLYEGFGLPPLEAMAAGTPALVGNYGAAREWLDGAAVFVDREDVDSIADGLMRIAGDHDLRQRIAAAGSERARSFTWERTAQATVGVYDAVLEG
jgi:glycosyltransferase involved in cell wall biosynthesis